MSGNEIFRLFGRVAIDNSDANKSIDETKGKGNSLATTLNNAFSKISAGAATCGKAIMTGLAAGTAAMGTLVAKSLGMAGELEQNMGGAEAVFGDHAQRMADEASKAFATMGLSQSDYLATANKMGALFKGMGFSIADSADMSANAMQRASDVASIMGLSADAAMEAVAGMAKGNFTMMDNLGVAMNDTALAAYAVEKGITKSYQSMSTNEKIGLAYEMFMERSAYAAGNYAKENDTLAGSLATAKAAWQNFMSGAMTQESMADMVSAFVNVGDVIIKNVNMLLPKLTKGLSTLIQRLTPKIPEMLQAILPGLIEGVVALITGLALALPDIFEIIVEQIPFLFEQLSSAVVKVFPELQKAFTEMSESIDFEALGALIGTMFVDLVNQLPEQLTNLGNTINYLWQTAVWPVIQGLFKAVFGVELPDWDKLGETIENAWTDTVWPAIQNFFKTTFGIELPDWRTVFSDISTWWNTLKTKTADFFKALFGLDFSDNDTEGRPWYERIWGWFVNVMSKLGSALLALFGLDFSDNDENGKPWYERIRDWFVNVMSSLGNFLLALVGLDFSDSDGTGKPWYERIMDWFINVMSSLGNFLLALVGLDFSDSDENGKPWYERISDWFVNVMSSLGGALLAVFGIDAEALANSIESTRKMIQDWWNTVKSGIALALGFTVYQSDTKTKVSAGETKGVSKGNKSSTTSGGGAALAYTKAFGVDDMGLSLPGIKGHASGLDFVPRDNYLARLHYGETVLNKEAAQAWRSGQTSGIDYDRLADAISQRPVAVNIDGKAIAALLSREMSRAIGNRNIQTLMGMGG